MANVRCSTLGHGNDNICAHLVHRLLDGVPASDVMKQRPKPVVGNRSDASFFYQ
jgi:hypothetical protein